MKRIAVLVTLLAALTFAGVAGADSGTASNGSPFVTQFASAGGSFTVTADFNQRKWNIYGLAVDDSTGTTVCYASEVSPPATASELTCTTPDLPAGDYTIRFTVQPFNGGKGNTSVTITVS